MFTRNLLAFLSWSYYYYGIMYMRTVSTVFNMTKRRLAWEEKNERHHRLRWQWSRDVEKERKMCLSVSWLWAWVHWPHPCVLCWLHLGPPKQLEDCRWIDRKSMLLALITSSTAHSRTFSISPRGVVIVFLINEASFFISTFSSLSILFSPRIEL